MPVVTGPAATRDSFASRDLRCNGSARTSAGVRWSAFGNASGGGNSVSPVPAPAEQSLHADRPDILMYWPAFPYIRTVPQGRGTRVLRWADDNLLHLKREEIGEHYGRYRLHLPEAERAMARSLQRYGQLSPIVVCRRQERYELIDGFKRLNAARGLAQIQHLSARLMEADERTAKAAIYGLNRAGGRTRELEEAWIIQALVREDGLSQVEVAELLGRHKSWVCRRLALIERLGPKARDELRVGLLSPTAARQIVRLPEGNQTEVLAAIRREALSSAELGGVVDLWLRCAERRQQEYLLAHPREALSQAKGTLPAAHDPRLSDVGNQVWKRVGLLLDVLGRMEVWLAHQGRTGLTPEDRVILSPRFQKLSRDAGSVAAQSKDFVGELDRK